jgi:hypothetical protein
MLQDERRVNWWSAIAMKLLFDSSKLAGEGISVKSPDHRREHRVAQSATAV